MVTGTTTLLAVILMNLFVAGTTTLIAVIVVIAGAVMVTGTTTLLAVIVVNLHMADTTALTAVSIRTLAKMGPAPRNVNKDANREQLVRSLMKRYLFVPGDVSLPY